MNFLLFFLFSLLKVPGEAPRSTSDWLRALGSRGGMLCSSGRWKHGLCSVHHTGERRDAPQNRWTIVRTHARAYSPSSPSLPTLDIPIVPIVVLPFHFDRTCHAPQSSPDGVPLAYAPVASTIVLLGCPGSFCLSMA